MADANHDPRPVSPQREENPGEVSEVTRLGETDDPIYPEDATAGAPDGESGRPEEAEAGPDAVPRPHEEGGTSRPVRVERRRPRS